LTNEQFRLLKEEPRKLKEQLCEMVDVSLQSLAISRLAGVIERRLGESMNLRATSSRGWIGRKFLPG
jgi:hypothetical protein